VNVIPAAFFLKKFDVQIADLQQLVFFPAENTVFCTKNFSENLQQ
jgi:hypothetical protein